MADRDGATEVPTPFDWRPVMSSAGFTLGIANVIMQLSHPAVGYGVFESKVDSGSAMKHPIKRSRTTFTYLSVALLGTDQDRADYRVAVNESHRLVHSSAESPVKYNAFDTGLQLWVAACLYKGFADMTDWLQPGLSEAEKDAMYRASAVLGTALQVRESDWPVDREAFAEYWERSLRENLRIDEPVREYLVRLMELRNFPAPIPQVLGKLSRFVATGWLPPEIRDAMALDWSESDQRWFERHNAVLKFAERLTPPVVRRAPWVMYLWDFRIRRALGLKLV